MTALEADLALSHISRAQHDDEDVPQSELPEDSMPESQVDGRARAEKPLESARPMARSTRAALKKYANIEDAELLRLFQQGEEQAYFALYERRQKEIFTHCLRMCNLDRDKASDAFQDTFVKIYTKSHLFKDATNGRAWLYRIATNTCLNMVRQEKRHVTEELDVSFESTDRRMQPDFHEEQNSLRGALEDAIGNLPMELREPFLLRELEEFSYEEISEQLGISVAACRQKVYRAKQMLRDSLEDTVNPTAPVVAQARPLAPPPKAEKKGWRERAFGSR